MFNTISITNIPTMGGRSQSFNDVLNHKPTPDNRQFSQPKKSNQLNTQEMAMAIRASKLI